MGPRRLIAGIACGLLVLAAAAAQADEAKDGHEKLNWFEVFLGVTKDRHPQDSSRHLATFALAYCSLLRILFADSLKQLIRYFPGRDHIAKVMFLSLE